MSRMSTSSRALSIEAMMEVTTTLSATSTSGSLDVPTASDELTKPIQLTTGNFDEHNPFWVPDGARIYFTTTRIDEPYYELPTTDIYSVPSSGGAAQKLTTIPMGIGDVALSPDGRRLAFHGEVTQPIRSYSQPDTWVMDLAPNASRAISRQI